ncbi:MAG: sensor histidine kinase [Chlorobi bacterium]|nr:sensor histidine kinase [Chlorobiota bacterium]
MRKLNITAIKVLNAFGITLLMLSYLLIVYFFWNINLFSVIIFVFLLFGITLYSYNFTIKHLVINRIKPLYKLISKTKISDSELKNELKKSDPILAFTKDFDSWTKEKATEVKQLTELEKYRKEFLGNVSHELKTPLFNIQGYIYTLLDGGLEDSTINRKYLERTDKSIDRLISIVKDLDSISKLEYGELLLKKDKFDINSLVSDVVEMQELRAKKKKIDLKISHTTAGSLIVEADKNLIAQVVTNLIVNSINYGKEKGWVKINYFEYDKNIIIEISDNGIGISEEHLSRIFERFYRVDQSRSRELGGTGLGLSIVKHIIEAHHQTINISSELNKGTSVAFTLKKMI